MIQSIKTFAKYGGFVAMAFEWSALVFFYLREPLFFNGNYPISYFATLPQTRAVFSVCYLGAAVSFWIFANHHLKERYRTPIKIFAFSMVGFAGVALFPYHPNSALSTVIHNILSQSSFGSFLVGMVLMAKHSDDRRFQLVTDCAVVMSALLMIGFLLAPKTSHLVLAFEASGWFLCQLWIIWISYRAYTKAAV